MSSGRDALIPDLASRAGEASAVSPSYELNQEDLTSLYPELKRIARQRMSAERDDHTLQPTALINELYLRLLKQPDFVWTDRSHFLIYASCAMRHLLIDYAKQRSAEKRGSALTRVDLGEVVDSLGISNLDNFMDINEALDELAASEPRRARVVELRFFAGLTFTEIGEALGVSDRTAKRDWALAEEWLRQRLGGGTSASGRMGED
jgi:RNA polymerase sigma-70 factor (ECF subfamily)